MKNLFPSLLKSGRRFELHAAIFAAQSFVHFLGAGCTPLKDPATEKAKAILVSTPISEEPLGIEASIEQLKAAGNPQADAEVVVKAKVGAGKGEIFERTSSEFLVSEIPVGEHANDAKHDADSCPFCRAREAKAPTVVVRLTDELGKPFPMGADKILGLSKGQHIVVKGLGKFDEASNYLLIESHQIQVAD